MKALEITDNSELRKRAERLTHLHPEEQEPVYPERMSGLLHELQVHQIELEIQNEELRRAQKAMEDVQNRFLRLYHNAPVGYVVIDRAGIVKQANTCFARMAGIDAAHLSGKAFADFLSDTDAAIFRSRFRVFFKNPLGKKMAVQMAGRSEQAIYAQIEALPHHQIEASTADDYDELLVTITDITEQKWAEQATEKALATSIAREQEIAALLDGARAVLERDDFPATARAIFDSCRKLTGATSGYVALLSDDGMENEVLFLEAGGLPCSVDPDLPMPIRGLRSVAYAENRTVFHNDFMNSPWIDQIPAGHVILKNVMFSPLVLGGKTMGIMGLANKAGDFNENDVRLATGFGELAAIALQNSLNINARNQIEIERKEMIQRLQKALDEVKTLSGFIPICASCKNIRDDQGYWNRIESYLHAHSDANFSHSICPDCAKLLYPDLDIYDENGTL